METSFRIETRPFPEGVIADLSGDLTKQAEDTVYSLVRPDGGLGDGRRYLVLNFTHVPYINSSGIAVLIRIVRSGRKSGFLTFSYGVTPHYQKLFRMVGLTEYMMLYPDEFAVLARIEALHDNG
ncbi:STAS domain-containing protein [Paenibacillus cymbidii]|uniref:STAS domain-containing protein n=1 Tax=Paenibacillus cymbidii TaxID=1639034 RepID=UPI001080E748|nr:STAS domain-containing protein [Paenibacillus cymbidii]